MYIEPRTGIKILSGVPLDTTYEHTLSWLDSSRQREYFYSKTKFSLLQQSYIRVSNGVARVGINAEQLYDCNYMMFQNTSFGTKWFYAFITDIVYVNNGMSEIHFTIDDLQTWYFEFHLDDCFVERETTETDVVGEHIEAEPVSTGEYIMERYQQIDEAGDLAVLVSVIPTTDKGGSVYDGIYSGTYLNAFPLDDDTDKDWLNEYLAHFYENPDNIVAMYMCPTNYLPIILNHGDYNPIPDRYSGKEQDVLPPSEQTVTKNVTKLQGYSPRNAKLLTYPYTYYSVEGGGSTLALRYEFFKNGLVKFRRLSNLTYPVCATLYPLGYKGASDGSIYKSENLQINQFPMCSWSVDAYKAYIAQNSIPNAIEGIQAGISSGLTYASGNAVGSFNTGLSYVAGAITREYRASIQSDIYKGNFHNGGIDSSHYINTFYGGRCSITSQQARIIDDFFTKYGYAINRVKKPNILSRPHFNYIKTVNCTATGNMPSDSMRNICHLFDNGITFWKDPTEVGNYSVDNRV